MDHSNTFRTGYECARCDNDEARELTKLAGVYHARLCSRCLNEWEQFFRPHDLWKTRQALESRGIMLVGMTCADGRDRTEELTRAAIDADGVSLQIFDLAAAWIREGP